MDSLPNPAPLETEAERQTRIQREHAIVAQGVAELDAGLGIDGDAVDAWFAALDLDENAPPPVARKAT